MKKLTLIITSFLMLGLFSVFNAAPTFASDVGNHAAIKKVVPSFVVVPYALTNVSEEMFVADHSATITPEGITVKETGTINAVNSTSKVELHSLVRRSCSNKYSDNSTGIKDVNYKALLRTRQTLFWQL